MSLLLALTGGGPAPATITGAGQIASTEAVGAPQIQGGIVTVAIASGEAFGASTIGALLTPQGIASAEAPGAPDVLAGIIAAAIASAESTGQPVVGATGITCTGIESTEAMGQPTVGDVSAAPVIPAGGGGSFDDYTHHRPVRVAVHPQRRNRKRRQSDLLFLGP